MLPNKAIINLAIQEAKQSKHRFRVGAVLYSNHGAWFGRGYNKADKTHPDSPHPFKSIHAEFAAFLDAYRYRYSWQWPKKGLNLYVHRLLQNDEPGLSKPCPFCWELLLRVGVKASNIHWSVGQEPIEESKARTAILHYIRSDL